MSQTPNENNERLERIVAYLDGELSAEESSRVEQQLATDQQFRQQLQGMQRAWDALDQLPVATVNDDFSRTTMEMVVATAQRDVSEKTLALPVQRRKRRLATALLVATAVLLGMLAFRILWQNPNRLLLADLALIDKIDIYSQFERVDFIAQLQQTLRDAEWPIGVDDEEVEAEVVRFQHLSDPSSRRPWLEQLSPVESVTLRAKFNRFRSLPDSEQQQLRELHAELVTEPGLHATMIRYERWLAEMPATGQFQLRQLSIDQRVRQVKDEIHRQAIDNALELSAEQLDALMDAMRQVVEENWSEADRKKFRSLSRNERMRHLGGAIREHSQLRKELYDAIAATLPEEKQKHFRQLRLPEVRDQILRWVEQSVKQHVAKNVVGNPRNFSEMTPQQREQQREQQLKQRLEQLFVGLDAAEQQRLLALPRDQMLRQLLVMFRGQWRQDRWKRALQGLRPPEDRPGPPPEELRRRGRHKERPQFDRPAPHERRGRGDRRPLPDGPPPRI